MSEKLASDKSDHCVIVLRGRSESTQSKMIKRTASHKEKKPTSAMCRTRQQQETQCGFDMRLSPRPKISLIVVGHVHCTHLTATHIEKKL